ncbi:hypothetical protein R3I93_015311 [Phoxinus phoxinus]|uniref:PLAC domain-containing protein n=1 Tax=Phoxinus phoxinus TaxID=58324 RepID=A0AAN9CNN1_9TELE
MSLSCFAGLRCHGDRSAFCRMEALQQYCSLPGFQRMCCKSCKVDNSTKITVIKSRPPSKSEITSKGRSTVSPTRTESTTAAFLPSTDGKRATSVSTPWLYTALATSSDTHGYTTMPVYPYTTTPIFKHATPDFLPEQSTSFTITTATRNTSAPGNDMVNSTELPASTVIPIIFNDVSDASLIPSTTVKFEEFNGTSGAPNVDNDVVLQSTTEYGELRTSGTKLPVSTVISIIFSDVSDASLIPSTTIQFEEFDESSGAPNVDNGAVLQSTTEYGVNENELTTSGTKLPVSTVFPIIFSDVSDATLIPSTTVQFEEFDESSGAPNVDNGAVPLSTTEYGVNENELTTSGKMVLGIPVESIAEVPTTTEESATMATTSISTTSSTPQSSTTASNTEKMSRRPNNMEKTSESNAIDMPYRVIPLDIEFPPNNIIPRRGRVFLREKTRNKRIQELLEEKRNFLRRMKRAQGI